MRRRSYWTRLLSCNVVVVGTAGVHMFPMFRTDMHSLKFSWSPFKSITVTFHGSFFRVGSVGWLQICFIDCPCAVCFEGVLCSDISRHRCKAVEQKNRFMCCCGNGLCAQQFVLLESVHSMLFRGSLMCSSLSKLVPTVLKDFALQVSMCVAS